MIRSMVTLPQVHAFKTGTDAEGQALKVLEEAAELLEAVKQHPESAIEEAMDVLQALGNLCAMERWGYQDMAEAYWGVRAKNEARGRSTA